MKANIEELKSLFVDPVLIAAEKVERIEIAGLRHYRRCNGKVHKSLTTFLDTVLPSNKFLNKWRENLAVELGSSEKASDYVNSTADYGSALHIAVADFIQKGECDWFDVETFFMSYLQGCDFKANTLKAATIELIHDFAAIIQFLYDYRVKVYAVEIPVFLEAGIATLIDLVVEMDIKKYDKTPFENRERHNAIINLKSGKKGFYETHIFQLEGEKRMWNETYGHILPIFEVYNLAPTEWRNGPDYKIKCQTEAIRKAKIDVQFDIYLESAKVRGLLEVPDKKFPVFQGVTKFGEDPNNCLKILNYHDITTLKK